MARHGAIRALAAAIAVTASATGAAGQKLGIQQKALAIPTITGVEAVSLQWAEGWPSRLLVYESSWTSAMELRVGVANVGQVEEIQVLDKSSRPARGFEAGFSPRPVTECAQGSSACIQLTVRPNGAEPGQYRIVVAGDGQMLNMDPAIEVVCDPRQKPISLTLSAREQRVSESTVITGRVVMACPALPPSTETMSGTVGSTTIVLRRPRLDVADLQHRANGLLDYPDTLVVPPGQSSAVFEIVAPMDVASPVWPHLPWVAAGVTASLESASSSVHQQAAEDARFLYPALEPASFPETVVGSDPVRGTLSLTQPSSLEEEICFTVYDSSGAMAGASGARITVSRPGTAGPACVSIAAGRTSAPFELTAEVTQPGHFTLVGIRRHRHSDGGISAALDTTRTEFGAWPAPALSRVTIGAPYSQPSFVDSYVDGSVSGQAAGYVSLTSAATPGGVKVDLACKPTDAIGEKLCERHVSLPESLRIPEGVQEFGFPIQIIATPTEGVVAIQAEFDGRETGSLLHVDLPPEVTSVGLSPSRYLTVWVEDEVRVSPIRIVVKASGEGAELLQMPEVVEVPVGERMVNVAVHWPLLEEPVEVTVTAIRQGGEIEVSKTEAIN